MSQFALDCLDKMHILVKKLEVHLGPDTGKSSRSSLSVFVVGSHFHHFLQFSRSGNENGDPQVSAC